MGCLQGTDAFASYAYSKKVTDRSTAKCSADRKTVTQKDRKTDNFAIYAHGKKVTQTNAEKCSADRQTERQKYKNTTRQKEQKTKRQLYPQGNKVTKYCAVLNEVNIKEPKKMAVFSCCTLQCPSFEV